MADPNDPPEPAPDRAERLRGRVRQLILMRETGPKRMGWHLARTRMIWRLHDQIRAEDAQRPHDEEAQRS